MQANISYVVKCEQLSMNWHLKGDLVHLFYLEYYEDK